MDTISDLPIQYAPLFKGFGLERRKYRQVFGPRTVHAIILAALVNGADYQNFQAGLFTTFNKLYCGYPGAVDACVKVPWFEIVFDDISNAIRLKSVGFNEDVEQELNTLGYEIKRITRNLDHEVYWKISSILYPQVVRKPPRRETEQMGQVQYLRLL